MDVLEKAKILGESGGYDSCGPKMCEVKVDSGLGGIYHAKAEHKTCRIFKTLMDNSCRFDCRYCANAAGCGKRRISYDPGELVRVFEYLNKNLEVEGLFLSSGIGENPDRSTEKMLEAVSSLRKRGFNGYVHFKALPGTSYELLKQASEISTRMSINLEAPNKSVLREFSSCKDYRIDILKRQAWMKSFNLKSGQTTQMVINKMSSDKDVLRMVEWEYDNINMRRIYFSAFTPVKGTCMEKEKAEPKTREIRLYNVDFLRRIYGYGIKEFFEVMDDGMLPDEDPKLALAKANFEKPVDVNEAAYEELIRIPGIGPRTGARIISGKKKIKRYSDLSKLGAWTERAKPFISVDGQSQKRLVEF